MMEVGKGPRYLEKEKMKRIKNGVGVLIGFRCGNTAEGNKYWLEESEKVCVFCERGKDII